MVKEYKLQLCQLTNCLQNVGGVLANDSSEGHELQLEGKQEIIMIVSVYERSSCLLRQYGTWSETFANELSGVKYSQLKENYINKKFNKTKQAFENKIK